MSDALNAQTRAEAISRLRAASAENPLDVLIVGGGVVGVGSALDAAARGMDVVLVEQRDLASGTSSRSSRLAHGGLRYLEQFEFGLVHEALTERGLLLDRLAPHLVRPVPFVFPVVNPVWERAYAGVGVALYDTLSRLGAYGGAMPRPKTLSKKKVKVVAPGLNEDAYGGAVTFYDAQIDDARHTMVTARTAAGRGAGIATGVKVVSLLRSPDGERVIGARVRVSPSGWIEAAGVDEGATREPRDLGVQAGTGSPADDALEDGALEFDVHARVVLSATGVWTDEVLRMAGADADAPAVRQSKGVHLVIPRDAFTSSSALIARTPTSVLFMLPWGPNWLVGTTDTDYEDGLAEPVVTAEDVDYLLEQANRWLSRPLTRDDVVGVYAGLRPLVNEGDDQDGTAEISREHTIFHPAPGVVAIAGGKYTTYRVMARDAVDAVAEQVSELTSREFGPCTTDEIPLAGAEGFDQAWAAREELAEVLGISLPQAQRLLRRHGDRVWDVVELVRADPALGEPMAPDSGYLTAEAVLAVRNEGASTLEDVVVRRTRIGLQMPDGGMEAARKIAPIVGAEMGWDAAEVDRQLAHLQERREWIYPTADLSGQ